MSRAQGGARATHAQDVLYVAGAGKRRSDACTGCAVYRGRREAQERRMHRTCGMSRLQRLTLRTNTIYNPPAQQSFLSLYASIQKCSGAISCR